MLEQIEILLAGENPDANGALTKNELALLRSSMRDDEALECFVRGRVVGSGAGLWVLTDQRLLVLQAKRRRTPLSLDPSAGEAVETVTGRYGTTISMRVGGVRYAMFGAGAQLSAAFARALHGRLPGPAARAPFLSLSGDEEAEVERWIAASRLLLQPAASRTAG